MRNFGALYKGEVKKIISKKSVWVLLFVGMLFVACTELSSLLPFDASGKYEFPDGTSMTSREVKHQERKTCETLAGKKMDDAFLNKMQKDIKNYLAEKKWLDYGDDERSEANQELWYAAEKLGYEAIVRMMYGEFQEEKDPYKAVMECSAAKYNRVVKSNMEGALNQENLTSGEKAYWLQKVKSREKTMTYAYTQGYQIYFEMFYMYMGLIFLLGMLSLSGVFSEEISNRMDAMILSTKNGRKSICLAKICAGMTVLAGEALSVLGFNLAICMVAFGHGGWDASLQLSVMGTSWNMTIGQAVILYWGLAMAASMVFAAVTMLLSQVLKNSTTVMAVQFGIFILGVFPMPDSLGAIADLWRIRPTYFLRYDTFLEHHLFNVGNRFFNVYQVAGVLYPMVIVIMLVLAYVCYQRTQVKSK